MTPTPATTPETAFAKAFREARGEDAAGRAADPGVAAVLAWQKARTPESTAAVLSAIDPLVGRALAARGAADPLAHARGRQAALKALGRYDPARAGLNTFLHQQLAGVGRQAARAVKPVRAAERVERDRARSQAAEAELEQELGRPPTAGEVADRVGVPLSRLTAVATHRPAAAAGAFAGGDGPGVRALGPDPAAAAWREMVYHDLDPYHQRIMEHTLGMFDRPVLGVSELGRLVSRSPGAVSQARARIQARLDEGAELSPFGPRG